MSSPSQSVLFDTILSSRRVINTSFGDFNYDDESKLILVRPGDQIDMSPVELPTHQRTMRPVGTESRRAQR